MSTSSLNSNVSSTETLNYHKKDAKEFITMSVSNQLFGISVHAVRDVLAAQKITNIPLAPPEIAGSLNLRGRIVTAIDIRKRLNIPLHNNQKDSMSIVVEHGEELYSLLVDSVGEVLRIAPSDLAHNPENLAPGWQEVSMGVFPLKETLLVILDVNKLLTFISGE
jgi:purine-binding chemotaxis protein CheW